MYLKKLQILFLILTVFFQCHSVYAVELYTKKSAPKIPDLRELDLMQSIKKDGITWTFSKPVRVGQFINGDYYVVGPTTIRAIDPPPNKGRNGSVLNLPPVNNKSGFDSRVLHNRYDPDLTAVPPINMKPGDSLISTISVDKIGSSGRILRRNKKTISPVKTASILTCLEAPVPPDSFRPSYCDTNNKIYLSRNLKRELLPNLAKVLQTPKIVDFEAYLQRPWLDTLQFGLDFPIEYMPNYGRELTRLISMATLLIMLDFATKEKEPLLIYLINYGIDLYGAVRAGHPGWPAYGGHGNGRKLAILFAGILLGDKEMQNPKCKFSEDMQTMYGKGWTGATALYAGHVGKDGFSNKTGWGAYEHLHPKDWESTIGESYRRCCTSVAWVGEALGARLLGAENVWAHPAFFDYVERWMTEDDTEHINIIEKFTGKGFRAKWARQGQAWDPFVENMWDAYWNMTHK